jgi:hypothetical protein
MAQVQIIEQYAKTYNKLYSFIEKNMKFNNEYSILQPNNPFYFPNTSKSINEIFDHLETKLSEEHLQFLNSKTDDNKYLIPLTLKLYYIILDDPNREGTIQVREHNGDGDGDDVDNKKDFLTFLSLNTIMENYNIYDNIVVIGINYYEMGYLRCLVMDKNTGNFFFTLDGGSDGHEVQYNFDFFKKVNPSEYIDLRKYRFPDILNKFEHYEMKENLINEFIFKTTLRN